MQFAQRLDHLLIERGISAYQISKATGISDRLIGYWRKGEKSPTLENAAKLSGYLGVSVDWLLTGEETMSNHIGNVNGGTFVQGNNSGTLIGVGDAKGKELTPEEIELLRVYASVDVKKRLRLMSFALELEEQG